MNHFFIYSQHCCFDLKSTTTLPQKTNNRHQVSVWIRSIIIDLSTVWDSVLLRNNELFLTSNVLIDQIFFSVASTMKINVARSYCLWRIWHIYYYIFIAQFMFVLMYSFQANCFCSDTTYITL